MQLRSNVLDPTLATDYYAWLDVSTPFAGPRRLFVRRFLAEAFAVKSRRHLTEKASAVLYDVLDDVLEIRLSSAQSHQCWRSPAQVSRESGSKGMSPCYSVEPGKDFAQRSLAGHRPPTGGRMISTGEAFG